MATKSRQKTLTNEAKRNAALVKRVAKRYGTVIDLKADPGMLIDIIRRFRDDVLFNDNPCGGTPPPLPSPGPSPGPSKAGGPVTNEDMMRAILRLTREINALKKVISRGQ